MTRFFHSASLFAAILLVAGVPLADAAKPGGGGGGGGKCTNPGIIWEMRDSYNNPLGGSPASFTSAIRGDGKRYVNGSEGVEAVLQVCSGSGDATLLMQQKGKTAARSVTYVFAGNSVVTTPDTPDWATGSVNGPAQLNVRSLTFEFDSGDRNTDYTFTTWFGSHPPDHTTYSFHMLNPVVDAIPDPNDPSHPNFPAANDPYLEAPVVVHHCAAGSTTAPCEGDAKESWFAYPDPSEINGFPAGINIGQLMDDSSPKRNAGQFSMPFYFKITVQ